MSIRSFIAVDPSPEVSEHLGSFIQRLSKETKGFKWVDPEAIHLTLRFLGDVEPSTLETLKDRLPQAVSGLAPISLQARGVGFFPNAQRPRVVWAGLEGEVEKLKALQARVAEAVEGFDVKPEEDRDVTPHLTLARVKDPQSAVGVARILQAGRESDFGEFVVSSVILYKSDLTPSGARYTKLETFQF